jgi:hypothetical protein
MMMIHNRKAQLHHGFSPGYFLIAGIIFLIMAVTLIITTNQYVSAFLAHDKLLPTHIYAYRAINTCLAYKDVEIDRFYPGIIDFSKYNQQNLDACYTNTEFKSFNIQLRDSGKDISYDRILVGFGASRNILSYNVAIRYPDGSISQGELLFGAS